MLLSERMRMGREAAPWVIEKVEELENSLPRWIPVEEQRPELGKLVLCKCLEDYPQVGYFVEEIDYGDEGMSYIFKNVYEDFKCVEAWCKLPEDAK